MIKVKNLKGTGGRAPSGYRSWLGYWEANTGQKVARCMRFPCNCVAGDLLVGAHVKKVGNFDMSWYIVPVCHATNNGADEFFVTGSLAPVNP